MKLIEHGTARGYRMELRRFIVPCTLCLMAANEQTRESLKKDRCVPGLGWPLGPGDIAPRKPRKLPPGLCTTCA